MSPAKCHTISAHLVVAPFAKRSPEDLQDFRIVLQCRKGMSIFLYRVTFIILCLYLLLRQLTAISTLTKKYKEYLNLFKRQ